MYTASVLSCVLEDVKIIGFQCDVLGRMTADKRNSAIRQSILCLSRWIVMVALCNRADHYIFAVISLFYLLSFFIPRLI